MRKKYATTQENGTSKVLNSKKSLRYAVQEPNHGQKDPTNADDLRFAGRSGAKADADAKMNASKIRTLIL